MMPCRADLVISSDVTEDFAQQVKEFTNGEMAYGAIDPVVGSMTGGSLLGFRVKDHSSAVFEFLDPFFTQWLT